MSPSLSRRPVKLSGYDCERSCRHLAAAARSQYCLQRQAGGTHQFNADTLKKGIEIASNPAASEDNSNANAVAKLTAQMKEAAENLDFEKAAEIRDRLKALQVLVF